MKKILVLLFAFVSACSTTTHDSEIIWENELLDGRLMYGKVTPETQIFIQEQDRNLGTKGLFEIPTHQGHFVVGIPQDGKNLKLTLKKEGQTKSLSYNIPKRLWKEDYVSGLPPKKVTPPKEEQQRIQSEFKAMRDKRVTSDFPQFPNSWQLPLTSYKRISSPFGSRRILNGEVKQGHSGTDYAAPTGTAVLAANKGKVVLTHPDMFYSGATILIDHGFGVYTSYAHLSKISVKEGDLVEAGDPIGQVGMSGRATGPHLHFGLSWYGVRLNPEDLF